MARMIDDSGGVALHERVNWPFEITGPYQFQGWLAFVIAHGQMHVLFRIKYGFTDFVAESPCEGHCLLGSPHGKTQMMKFKIGIHDVYLNNENICFNSGKVFAKKIKEAAQ